MKKIYIYCKDTNPDGIQVIIKNLRKSLNEYDYELEEINNLNRLEKKDLVIPYGILASFRLLFSRHKCILSLMVDAMSLGLYTETKYYKTKKIYNTIQAYKNYLKTYLFLFMEAIVLLLYKRTMLVSPNDKNYFIRILPFKKDIEKKIIVVKNGVTIPNVTFNKRIEKDNIRIGVLSYWNFNPYKALTCFLNEYSNQLHIDFPNLKIVIAGRNLSEEMKQYLSKFPNVEIKGEVETLNDFFSDIHAMLNVLPKECGVLNKLLDSMAYKTPILSMPCSFKAFDGIGNDAFLCYENYYQLRNCIMNLQIEKMEEMSNICFEYILKNHSWSDNYNQFVIELITII